MPRPRIEIDWDEFDKLCELHCTQEEIASFFGCSVDTIERAVKRDHKCRFAEYYEKRTGKGRASLRRLQWKAAEGGNVTMQIWLGKQLLGQRDKPEEPDSTANEAIEKLLTGVTAAATAIASANEKANDTESETGEGLSGGE